MIFEINVPLGFEIFFVVVNDWKTLFGPEVYLRDVLIFGENAEINVGTIDFEIVFYFWVLGFWKGCGWDFFGFEIVFIVVKMI